MEFDFLSCSLANVRRQSFVAVLLLLIASRAVGETNELASVAASQVTGQVRLLQTSSGEAPKDNSEVVVWLVPLDALEKVRLKIGAPRYQMLQHNKLFEPHLLVVPVGSVVQFPNYDPYFHNVFSVSNTRRFDLGLFQAGARKVVRFDRAGAVFVFCNIHPEMMAVVLAVDSPYFAVSDRMGRLLIGNVSPGRYLLRVWYENSTRQALEALEHTIVVGNDDLRLATITVAMTTQKTTRPRD